MSVAVMDTKEGEKQMNTGMNNAINLFIRKLSEKLMGFSQDGAWRVAAVAALFFASSLPQGAQAQTVFVKANNSTALSLPGSWTNNAVPGASDIAQWDSTEQQNYANFTSMGDSVSWGSIRILNPGQNFNIYDGSNLTLNASGTAIDMSAATVDFSIFPNVILATNQTWNVGTSRSLTVGLTGGNFNLGMGGIGGGFSLNKAGAGTLNIGTRASTCALTVMGGTLNLTGSNTYSGVTTVSAGSLYVAGANGCLCNASGIVVSNATLVIGDVNYALPDRINDAAKVTFCGGALTLQGKNSTATTETIGTLTIGAGGHSTVTVAPGSSSTAVLTLTSLSHSGTGGTATLGGTGTIAASPALTNGILGGWAVWGGSTSGQRGNAVTTNASGNLTYFTAFDKTYTATTSGINNWTATQNIYINPSSSPLTVTLSADLSANSLTFLDITANPTLDLGGKTLSLTSGGIFYPCQGNGRGYTIQNGTLTAGNGTAPAELFITSASWNYGVRSTISAAISNNNGQAVSVVQPVNPGAYVGNLLSGNNGYSGGTYINSGYIYINNDFNLGAVGGAVYFQGGSLGIWSTLTLNASRNLVAAANATATIDTYYAATKSTANVCTIAGKVTGTGNFAKTGTIPLTPADTGPLAGMVILTNTGNDWAGTTTVSAGILQIGDGTTTAGSLPDRPVSLSGANTTLKFANPTAVNFNSVISGSGDLIKSGAGTLTLGGVNTYSNGTTISGGILAIASDTNLGAAYDGSVSGATVTNIGGGYCASGTTNWSFTFSAPPSGTTASGSNTASYITAQGQLRNVTWLSGGSGYVAPPTAFVGGAGSGGGIQAYVKGLLTLDGGTLQTTAGITSSRAVYLTSNNGAIDTAGNSSTFSGVFNGPGGLTKTGVGTLTLSATNTYTGGTVVSNGMFLVNGAITGTVTVVSGGTLGGTGTVGIVSNLLGGTIQGSLAMQSLNLSAGSTQAVTLSSASSYSQLTVAGGVSLNGAALQLTLGFAPAVGQTFAIVKGGFASSTHFTTSASVSGSTVTAIYNGRTYTFGINYAGDAGGNDIVLTRLPTATLMVIE